MTGDDPLLELAGRLADGRELLWAEAEQSAARDGRGAELHGLHLLAELVASLGPPESEPEGSESPRTWGPLQLRARIGAGTFGEVFRAYDPHLRREVALKLLRGGQADSAAGARLLSEARRLARVRHPSVIVVHGAEEHAGRPGLWMELVPGPTLAESLAAAGPLAAREAMQVGLELCRALQAVHAAGLVHEDLKAGNVVREPGGRVVLMDFGAGALAPGLTPLYAAPELLQGRPPDAQSDLYALGVLLFHLVTGDYPVAGESLAALRAAHSRGARRSLRTLRAELPDDFVAVVERALAPLGRRFPSAAAFEAALLQCLAPASPTRARRRLLLAVALATAGAGLALLVSRTPEPEPIAAPVPAASAATPLPAPKPDPSQVLADAPPSAAPAAPAAAPAGATPASVEPASESRAAPVDPAVAALEARLAELAPHAARAQALRENHERICSGVRRVEQRNPQDDTVVTTFVPNTELPECRAESVELLQLESRIRRGITQVEDNARRERVLPGTVRALRERYGLDSNRWDFPP